MGLFDDLLRNMFGGNPLQTLPSPVITANGNVVTITGTGTIYYTTDGSTPTTSSPVYTSPITVELTTTFKAFSVLPGMNDSAVATYTVEILGKLDAPVIKQSGNTVTITGTGTIHYTTNGTTPDSSSTVYSGAITIQKDTIFKAYCTAVGREDSDVTTYVAVTDEDVSSLPFYLQNLTSSSGKIHILPNRLIDLDIEIYTSTDNEHWTYQGTTPTYPYAMEITLPANGRVYMKSTSGLPWGYKDSSVNPKYSGNYISVNVDFTVGGNITSLLYANGFTSPNIVIPKYAFTHLFNQEDDLSSSTIHLMNVSKLVFPTKTSEGCYSFMFYKCILTSSKVTLPATTLSKECYHGMFYNTGIEECILPATTLVDGCYSEMFYLCPKLTYIKAMFTTDPATGVPTRYPYTENWVFGVADSGTFVKNYSAYWSGVSYNTVPAGWTVERATS